MVSTVIISCFSSSVIGSAGALISSLFMATPAGRSPVMFSAAAPPPSVCLIAVTQRSKCLTRDSRSSAIAVACDSKELSILGMGKVRSSFDEPDRLVPAKILSTACRSSSKDSFELLTSVRASFMLSSEAFNAVCNPSTPCSSTKSRRVFGSSSSGLNDASTIVDLSWSSVRRSRASALSRFLITASKSFRDL